MIKVLIAEDEPLSLQNLTGHLRRLLGADALIEGAANGREAVDIAAYPSAAGADGHRNAGNDRSGCRGDHP